MRFTTIITFLLLLGALAVGVMIDRNNLNIDTIDSTLDNASAIVYNVSFTNANIDFPNGRGIMLVIEKYMHFMGAFIFEIFRTGIHFGHDNPDYFEPTFVFKIIKLIIVLVIVSLIIKPLFYLGVIIILLGIWVHNKFFTKTSHKIKK